MHCMPGRGSPPTEVSGDVATMRSVGAGADWNSIDAVIFDVDGTLFDHKGLRVPLLFELLKSIILGRARPHDLRVLKVFRAFRESLAVGEHANIGRAQYNGPARTLGMTSEAVEAIVTLWMVEAPLRHMKSSAYAGAREFACLLSDKGIRTGVFSDYPATRKLSALQIEVDVVRDASSEDIGRLKPSPDGFLRVADLLDVTPERCLIIGDRDDRDGEAARRGGFMFLRKVHSSRSKAVREFESYLDLAREVSEGRRI